MVLEDSFVFGVEMFLFLNIYILMSVNVVIVILLIEVFREGVMSI